MTRFMQVAVAGLVALNVYAIANATIPAGGITGSGIVPNQPVRPGQVVPVDWTLHKTTDCPGSSGRVWRGEDGFYLSEALRATGLPQTDYAMTYHIQTKIPDLAPAGQLSLWIVGGYDCGGIFGSTDFRLGPVTMEVVK